MRHAFTERKDTSSLRRKSDTPYRKEGTNGTATELNQSPSHIHLTLLPKTLESMRVRQDHIRSDNCSENSATRSDRARSWVLARRTYLLRHKQDPRERRARRAEALSAKCSVFLWLGSISHPHPKLLHADATPSALAMAALTVDLAALTEDATS